jgi:hypothetical protein
MLLLLPEEGVVVAMLSNASAPITQSAAWSIAEPFLSPRPMDLSHVDHSGIYDCTYLSEEGERQTATAQVLGSPEDYLLRVTTPRGTGEGILVWSEGRRLRAVALEDGFWVTNLWLTQQGEQATGHWGSIPLTCDVR